MKDFYLNKPLAKDEYMLVPKHMIPNDIIDELRLNEKFRNNMILAEYVRSSPSRKNIL